MEKLDVKVSKSDLRFLEYENLDNLNLPKDLYSNLKNYSLIHIDEKWFSKFYINNYIDIQINRHYNTLNAYYIQPNIIKHNFKIKSSRNHDKKFKYPRYFIEESKIVDTI